MARSRRSDRFSTGGRTVSFDASGAAFATDGTSGPLYSPHQRFSVYDDQTETTVVTWQGNDLDPQVAAYDHDTGTWSDQYRVRPNPMDDDDHGPPRSVGRRTITTTSSTAPTPPSRNAPARRIRTASRRGPTGRTSERR